MATRSSAGTMPNVNEPTWVNLQARMADRLYKEGDDDNKRAYALQDQDRLERQRVAERGGSAALAAERTREVGRAQLDVQDEAAARGYDLTGGGQRRYGGRTQPVSQQATELARYIQETHGVSPLIAAAIVGTGMAESGLNPTAIHDNNTGFGAFAHRDAGNAGGNRRTQMRQWAQQNNRDPNDIRTQADFLMHELRTTERYAGDRLFAARTPQEATAAMLDTMRPRNYTRANPWRGDNASGRLANTQQVLRHLGAGTGSRRSDRMVAELDQQAQIAQQGQQGQQPGAENGQLTDEQGRPYTRTALASRDYQLLNQQYPGQFVIDPNPLPNGRVVYRNYGRPGVVAPGGMNAVPIPSSRGAAAARQQTQGTTQVAPPTSPAATSNAPGTATQQPRQMMRQQVQQPGDDDDEDDAEATNYGDE